MAFVPLHNHSDYSLLDGASQISKIVDRACDLGMESIALTDHGVMYGVLDYLSINFKNISGVQNSILI